MLQMYQLKYTISVVDTNCTAGKYHVQNSSTCIYSNTLLLIDTTVVHIGTRTEYDSYSGKHLHQTHWARGR